MARKATALFEELTSQHVQQLHIAEGRLRTWLGEPSPSSVAAATPPGVSSHDLHVVDAWIRQQVQNEDEYDIQRAIRDRKLKRLRQREHSEESVDDEGGAESSESSTDGESFAEEGTEHAEDGHGQSTNGNSHTDHQPSTFAYVLSGSGAKPLLPDSAGSEEDGAQLNASTESIPDPQLKATLRAMERTVRNSAAGEPISTPAASDQVGTSPAPLGMSLAVADDSSSSSRRAAPRSSLHQLVRVETVPPALTQRPNVQVSDLDLSAVQALEARSPYLSNGQYTHSGMTGQLVEDPRAQDQLNSAGGANNAVGVIDAVEDASVIFQDPPADVVR